MIMTCIYTNNIIKAVITISILLTPMLMEEYLLAYYFLSHLCVNKMVSDKDGPTNIHHVY